MLEDCGQGCGDVAVRVPGDERARVDERVVRRPRARDAREQALDGPRAVEQLERQRKKLMDGDDSDSSSSNISVFDPFMSKRERKEEKADRKATNRPISPKKGAFPDDDGDDSDDMIFGDDDNLDDY